MSKQQQNRQVMSILTNARNQEGFKTKCIYFTEKFKFELDLKTRPSSSHARRSIKMKNLIFPPSVQPNSRFPIG